MILLLIAQLVSAHPPLSPAEAAAVLSAPHAANWTTPDLKPDTPRLEALPSAPRMHIVAPLRAQYDVDMERFNRAALLGPYLAYGWNWTPIATTGTVGSRHSFRQRQAGRASGR